MGNIATYQIKIIFNKGKRNEWMNDHSLTETINDLRGNNWSYEVPIVISPNYSHFQFGEKNSLFENLGPIDAKEKLINEIWEKDKRNCIQKIYYRSSEDSGRNDTIFSSVKGKLSVERFCRYGFDQIRFKLREGEIIQEYEIKNLNLSENTINLNGSYLNQNCRSQIVSYEELLTKEYMDIESVYQTLTTFTTSSFHYPESFQPNTLNYKLRLFFRACDHIEFKWKERTTLILQNKSNEKFKDWYESKSNDYWDNVVDIEYYEDHFETNNEWNKNTRLNEEKYGR